MTPKPNDGQHGWFKAMRGDAPMTLIRQNPSAFVLAYVIALRARWRGVSFDPYGLELGEAMLGDYRECGMSEQNYRTAKKQLAKWGFATFRVTNRGTIGKLIDTRLFSILPSTLNDHNNGQSTEAQQASDGQLTGFQRLTKKERAEEQKNKRAKKTGEDSAHAGAGRCHSDLIAAKPVNRQEVVEYFAALNAGHPHGYEFAQTRADDFIAYNEQREWKTKNWRRAAKRFNAKLHEEEHRS